MLHLEIPECEFFDEATMQFHRIKPQTITMEHSLMSISKWESKWHKSFLSTKDKTTEEILDYMNCMTLTQNIDPYLFYALPKSAIDKISAYIADPMTATVISTHTPEGAAPKNKNQIITSELIYYKMIAYNVPQEYQKWHINRLLMLLQICDIKNEPPKKVGAKQNAMSRSALNASRRNRLGSRG